MTCAAFSVTGRPGAEIIEMSGLAQATIEVDRVGLRDGFQPLSVLRILQIVKDVRRREFDFVIDLHSFAETNLLGFLSKARNRLFARRPGRSRTCWIASCASRILTCAST